jgi:hypothetical protein
VPEICLPELSVTVVPFGLNRTEPVKEVIFIVTGPAGLTWNVVPVMSVGSAFITHIDKFLRDCWQDSRKMLGS